MFLKEAVLLSSLNHPNIVQVLGVKRSEDHCFMVTEFVLADTLRSMLRARGRFSEELLKPIIRQAASAFDYMHNMNVAHGDIKPANLLYSEAAVLKVVDFGMATTFERGKLIQYRGGTRRYMSPEMVQRKNYYGPAADVWALGVTLHTLLNIEYPFKKDELKELQTTGHLNYMPPPRIGQSCTSLLKCMFCDDPSLRFSMEDILHHPWTTGHSETTVQELTDKDDEIQEDKEDVSLSSSPEELESKRMKTEDDGEQKLEKEEEIKIDDDSQSVRVSVEDMEEQQKKKKKKPKGKGEKHPVWKRVKNFFHKLKAKKVPVQTCEGLNNRELFEQNQLLQKENEQLQQEKQLLQKRNEQLQQEKELLQTEKEQLQQAQQLLQTEKEHLQQEKQLLQPEKEQLQQEKQLLQTEKEQLQTKNKILEEQLNNMNEHIHAQELELVFWKHQTRYLTKKVEDQDFEMTIQQQNSMKKKRKTRPNAHFKLRNSRPLDI
uniref:uncharacterized protein isoform X2 n=1 Tax=Myxine glutinosa TaxID=7769 RepID=UPI00358F562A